MSSGPISEAHKQAFALYEKAASELARHQKAIRVILAAVTSSDMSAMFFDRRVGLWTGIVKADRDGQPIKNFPGVLGATMCWIHADGVRSGAVSYREPREAHRGIWFLREHCQLDERFDHELNHRMLKLADEMVDAGEVAGSTVHMNTVEDLEQLAERLSSG